MNFIASNKVNQKTGHYTCILLRIYHYLHRYIIICTDISLFAQIYHYLHRYIIICTDISLFAQIYHYLHRYIIICTDIYIKHYLFAGKFTWGGFARRWLARTFNERYLQYVRHSLVYIHCSV